MFRRRRTRVAAASGAGAGRGEPAFAAVRLHARRHPVPPGAEVPLVAAVELGRRRRARAELRYLLGVGAVLAAPRPREVLPALQAVPRRPEAPPAGQLFAALHPAGEIGTAPGRERVMQ